MKKRNGLHVALMRGINLAAHNRVPMAELVTLFEKAKCEDVRTYIASGNVVFRASDSVAEEIAGSIAAAVAKKFKLSLPVVTRTAEELHDALGANPFRRADENELGIAFLAAAPTKKQIESLDPDRSPPDEFRVIGREVYLRLPNGFAKTKLTNAWFDKQLATLSTMRNWRTLQKLVEMTAAK